MLKKNRRLLVAVAIVAVPLLVLVWLALFYTEVGMANEIGEGAREISLAEYNYAAIPESVINDATELAKEIAGDSQEKLQIVVDQLLFSYVKAMENDVVVVFNSGGWGWNLLEDTPGWSSIVEGITTELQNSGYRSVVLNYQRTSHNLKSVLKEFIELLSHSPSKANEQAKRLEFITGHLPEVRIIVAGESTGTVVTDGTMNRLKGNSQVYSIQTGPPFWLKTSELERTLLMHSNGSIDDSFSYGKFATIFSATIKGWFGLLEPEENPGTLLTWLRAPGHDYSWQYPEVCSEVVDFLKANFGK